MMNLLFKSTKTFIAIMDFCANKIFIDLISDFLLYSSEGEL